MAIRRVSVPETGVRTTPAAKPSTPATPARGKITESGEGWKAKTSTRVATTKAGSARAKADACPDEPAKANKSKNTTAPTPRRVRTSE
jgi:hypothetical protein